MINWNYFIHLGMTRLRAILLYELQAVLSVRCRKLCLTQSISKEELQANVKVIFLKLLLYKCFNENLILHFDKVVRKMLQESSTIFSWEPEETDEGRLAIISSKELKDVELFLKTLD